MNPVIRVLYVDDSPLDRELVRDALEKEHGGFIVTEAGSREEFEAQLEARDYDLILSDFNIMGFDGLDVLDAVQSRRPGIPVVIVTGTGSETVAAEAIKRGAADYVIKTTQHILHLPKTIHAVIDKQRMAEEHRIWQSKLQQSEERFRAIFEHAPQGLVMCDEVGRLISANRVWLEMFGYSEQEARNVTYRDITLEEDFDKTMALLSGLFSGQTSSYRVERRFLRKDGTMFWGDCSMRLLPNTNSGVKQALGAVVDITERKQAEEAILRSEAKHRALVESAPIGIIVVDSQGHIVEANQALVDVFGSPSAEATKAINMFTFPPLVEAGISQSFRHCMEEDCPTDYETPYTSKWGKETHLKIRLTRLGHPVDGSPKCLGVIEDVSAIKKAQKDLENSENLMRVILDGISTNVAFVNENLEIIWVNKAAADSVGRRPEDMHGKKCHSFWAEPGKPCDDCPTVKAMKTRKSQWKEITTPDGRVWDERGEPIFDSDGLLLGAVEIANDITDRKRAEDELRRSETRFKDIYDRAPVMMHSIDRQARIRNVNEKWLSTLGYERQEVLGEEIASFLPPKTGEFFKRFIADFWRHREVHDLHYQFCKKDGSIIDVILDSIVLDDETWGEISLSTLRDVTQLKKAEHALEESRRSFMNVVESSADGIVVLDLAGTVMYGNRAAAAILGRERDRLPGMFLGAPKSIGVPFETEMIRPSGAVRIVDMSSSHTNWEGNLAYIVVMRDVTGPREKEAERRRLATAIDQSAESVVITDERGRILYVNPAFEKITGYSKEEAIGRNPRVLKSGNHDAAFYEEMWKTLTQGQVWKGHLINRRKDGSLYEEDATISPIKDDSGKVTSYVAAKRDVTDEVLLRKQLQKAQKMESIATLAGGIAHDFNNLLTIASGYTELLLMDINEASPGFQELEAIAHATQRGADLVKRILTFSRQVETFPTALNLNDEVRQVQKLLYRTLPKMIEIELVLGEGLKTVTADPGQIEQTLLNLAVNAQHAMPDGGKLTIETKNVTLDAEYCATHVDATPGDYVLLMVSDTGHGMEQDVLDHIFEPFFTTKKSGEGTGLGLSMVFGIVKGHGGHITCYSEPGAGTTFEIYLPTGERIAAEPDTAASGVRPALGTETILLVDDEEMIRDLGSRILKQAGYTVITAETGKAALEIYQTRREAIALVVLDMIMPEMGGRECLERLVALDPEVKVVVASGFSMSGPAKEAVKALSRGFVGKPFDVNQFQRTVRRALDGE